ncbi:MAG TPA: dihydroorotate dehydrogenase-like protein [Methylomirabilota bacterium]|nr:dihydroorotate dehydrogenase-like protein [Methylomirabilota bacterium]
MNLKTTYMGLKLRTPLVVSASPLSENLDQIKRMEDAGASAVVLYSLFEEQIRYERYELHWSTTQGTESYPEALSYFPDPRELSVGPEAYLQHIAKAKECVSIPVIASLNGSTPGGWTGFARQIEQAGADALELNLYSVPTDMKLSGAELEEQYVEVLRTVRREVAIPLAVKLSPFFTNFAHVAALFAESGANGLVLFNRFYQPDIELESLEVAPNVFYSTPMAMRLPMRWIAILHDRPGCSLAATSGIHRGTDALKMLMAGADVTMLCSVLMRRGIGHLKVIEEEMVNWMREHEYASVEQLKGSLSHRNCPDPAAFERAQYMRAVGVHRG